MKVAAYIRVSTATKSGEVGQSTAMQRADIIKYLSLQDISSEAIVFYDEPGVSGDSTTRPVFDAMMADIRSGKYQALCVWKLDRLCRSLHTLLGITKECTALGVAVMGVKDNIDLSSSVGRLLVQIMGSFAEFELSLIRERSAAGMRYARLHGTKSGKPIGRAWEVDVDAVKRLRASGMGYKEIRLKLGCSHGQVSRALKHRR